MKWRQALVPDVITFESNETCVPHELSEAIA